MKSLLTQKLPDSTMVLIHSKKLVKERWDEVVKEYMLKSEYAKTGLRAKFLGMKCTDKGGVREFLEGLQLKKEELCQARVEIEENDYFQSLYHPYQQLWQISPRANWQLLVFP